jgi:hypothetical protein
MRVILLLMIRQAMFPTVYTLIFWFGHEVLEFGGFYRDEVGGYGYGHLRESSVTGLGGTGRLEASFGIKSRRHGVRQSSFTVFDARMAYISEHHLLRTPLQKLQNQIQRKALVDLHCGLRSGPSDILERDSKA